MSTTAAREDALPPFSIIRWMAPRAVLLFAAFAIALMIALQLDSPVALNLYVATLLLAGHALVWQMLAAITRRP